MGKLSGGKLKMSGPDTKVKPVPVKVKSVVIGGGKKTSMSGPDLSGGGHVK